MSRNVFHFVNFFLNRYKNIKKLQLILLEILSFLFIYKVCYYIIFLLIVIIIRLKYSFGYDD